MAIVDYGLGNLYSVKHACSHVGLSATVTAVAGEILAADAVILPGVGAFGDAMNTLKALDLVSVIQDVVASHRPLLGICLGMQLLMTESEEFGAHQGLGLIEGRVVKLANPRDGDRALKVPQIGWNGIYRTPAADRTSDPWTDTLLMGIADGEPMYFVHSYVVQPADSRVTISTTSYGGLCFCSSIQSSNVISCQFHPERSGPQGLKVYRSLAALVAAGTKEKISD